MLTKEKTMKKSLAVFTILTMSATGAFAADITPYVGLGLLVDKAGTSAKRVGLDVTHTPIFVEGAGGDMDFDAAIAGEFTAGIKYGHLRGEFEYALRSASEDDYELFEGDVSKIGFGTPGTLAEIETSTSVKHNSYMFNLYYDFDLENSKWQPYVGAGVGLGTYKQHASVDLEFENDLVPDMNLYEVKNDKKEFEWQLAVGTTYMFTEDWAADIAYRFNSSTVSDEFVYSHEVKLGLRYSF